MRWVENEFQKFHGSSFSKESNIFKKNTSKIHAENVPTEVVSASVQLRT